MPSRLWVLWVGGLVLGLASPCPSPCSCPPSLALTCHGCPTDYLAVSSDTLSLTVSGCKDILYLLRLHRPLPPDKHVGKFSLQKLQITDSLIEKIPESYVNNDYAIQSLVMSNNSIQTLDVGLEASNLTYLDLSCNYLSFIKNRTFERMNNIVFLDLGSNRLQNMSVQAFSGLSKLVHLDLSRNNLTYLLDAIFLPLVSLQRLNLSSNKLEALSEKCFGSLLLLQQLDISYNRLTSVAPGTLQFLPNLAKLLLADNPQLRPDAQIFVGTGRRLQQVDASRTGLRRVPEALTHSVRYLSLAGNRITTLRCGDLDGYPLLHMLDFADNIIENVEDDALGRLEMISRLYLNRNKLQTVPKMLPDKLSYLSLDTNLIKNLTLADFATLGSLKILLLSNNLISFIQENTFMQLISLEVLDVSNNPLKALTPNTFGGPVSLKDFRIAFVDISPPAKDISFPVPSPEGMERLHLQHSAGLARELLADTAALAAMARLQYLDIRFSDIVNIRSDLLHFFPQLKYLRLEGNNVNCSELNWLAQWMRDNMDDEFKTLKCFSPPAWAGKLVIDLPPVIKIETEVVKHRTTTQNSIITNTSQTVLYHHSQSENHYIANIVDIEHVTKIYNTPDINEQPSKYDKYLTKNISTTATSTPNVLSFSQTRKPNQMGQSDQLKSLLDFQYDSQHHVTFNASKNVNSQKQSISDGKKPNEKDTKLRSMMLERKALALLNVDMTDKNTASGDNKSKKINKPISIRNFTVDMSDQRKLIEIFSQLSQKENNGTNSSKEQNTELMAQESVSMCIAAGNLNGTENKTKCSLHPEIAPVPSEKNENKNIKPGRFIYRKNGNDKSSINAKPRKSKYVSRPNERYNITYPRDGKSGGGNGTAIKTRQLANQTRVSESLQLVLERANLYQHNLHGPTLSDGALNKIASDAKADTKVANATDGNNNDNKINTSDSVQEERSYELAKMEEQGGENVSEHQTSRYRAEAGGQSGLGLGALVGVCGAACAALAGACLARRRPRGPRLGGPEMMEVQTITAVGELW